MLVDSCSFELICVLVDQYVILSCLVCQCLHFLLDSFFPWPMEKRKSGKIKKPWRHLHGHLPLLQSRTLWRAYWGILEASKNSRDEGGLKVAFMANVCNRENSNSHLYHRTQAESESKPARTNLSLMQGGSSKQVLWHARKQNISRVFSQSSVGIEKFRNKHGWFEKQTNCHFKYIYVGLEGECVHPVCLSSVEGKHLPDVHAAEGHSL